MIGHKQNWISRVHEKQEFVKQKIVNEMRKKNWIRLSNKVGKKNWFLPSQFGNLKYTKICLVADVETFFAIRLATDWKVSVVAIWLLLVCEHNSPDYDISQRKKRKKHYDTAAIYFSRIWRWWSMNLISSSSSPLLVSLSFWYFFTTRLRRLSSAHTRLLYQTSERRWRRTVGRLEARAKDVT